MVDATSSRRLVLHTPGQELLAINVDGWDHEALAASITNCTGNPLQRVRWKRTWWSYRYEFASVCLVAAAAVGEAVVEACQSR